MTEEITSKNLDPRCKAAVGVGLKHIQPRLTPFGVQCSCELDFACVDPDTGAACNPTQYLFSVPTNVGCIDIVCVYTCVHATYVMYAAYVCTCTYQCGIYVFTGQTGSERRVDSASPAKSLHRFSTSRRHIE